MKKKVFFILSSLRAGGAEKVFWLISQNFDKSLFDVSIILLSSRDSFFPNPLKGVRTVDLKTEKASRSFFKLQNLLRKERPDVVFATGGQINLLLGFISIIVKVPLLIARPTNQDNTRFIGFKAQALRLISKDWYNRFDLIICQSYEIKEFLLKKNPQIENKLIILPNPVVNNDIYRQPNPGTAVIRLVVVARLTPQKGISRLLQIMSGLPNQYQLTIVGNGILKEQIAEQITNLNLQKRVKMIGAIKNVLEVVAEHDVFVLPSFIEGFPNVVVESLSVGTPVVSFEVGGISEIVINGFNGFIITQSDLESFKNKITEAATARWDHDAIRKDIFDRFGIDKITKRYEAIITESININSSHRPVNH